MQSPAIVVQTLAVSGSEVHAVAIGYAMLRDSVGVSDDSSFNPQAANQFDTGAWQHRRRHAAKGAL